MRTNNALPIDNAIDPSRSTGNYCQACPNNALPIGNAIDHRKTKIQETENALTMHCLTTMLLTHDTLNRAIGSLF